MAGTRNCPNCGLLNPPEALVCDCGYDFASKQVILSNNSERQSPMEFTTVLFSFDGRINRRTFWLTMLSLWAALSLVWLIIVIVVAADQPGIALATLPLIGVLLWCSYAICAKRWHDRNKTGWWSLINFVPIIGGLWLLIELGFMPGTDGRNYYGPPP